MPKNRYSPQLLHEMAAFAEEHLTDGVGNSGGVQAIEDGEFGRRAWDGFDPDFALKTLLDERQTFFGLKEVLFAGFCAWVVNPNDSSLIKSAMLIAISKKMETFEILVQDDLGEVGILADFVVRFKLAGPKFLREIYYAVGGISSFTKAAPAVGYRRRARRALLGHELAIKIVEYSHYSIEGGGPAVVFSQPSLARAAKTIDDMGLGGERWTKEKWARFKGSVEFIYTAAKIPYEGGSLLDAISSNTAKYDVRLLRDWLGRSRFIAENVVELLPNREGFERPPRRWRSVKSVSVDVPVLSPEEIRMVVRNYG